MHYMSVQNDHTTDVFMHLIPEGVFIQLYISGDGGDGACGNVGESAVVLFRTHRRWVYDNWCFRGLKVLKTLKSKSRVIQRQNISTQTRHAERLHEVVHFIWQHFTEQRKFLTWDTRLTARIRHLAWGPDLSCGAHIGLMALCCGIHARFLYLIL